LEPALFRPPLPRLLRPLLVGAVAGAAIGTVAAVPPLLAALFGALASAITLSVRQARGLHVAADERGLRVVRGPSALDGAWAELRLGFGLAQRADGSIQRYAVVADAQGRSFAFAEPALSPVERPVVGADGRPVPIVAFRDAALLLAVVVERTGATFVFPEALRPAPAAASTATTTTTGTTTATGTSNEIATATRTSAGATSRTGAGRTREAHPALGLWALAAKLGTKLLGLATKAGTGALKAAKTAHVGWAVASTAAYSLLFSWKFALAIMVQLFIHEYGHVHAMRRTGMKVRGMYFVPFLGALAVTEDAFTSRRQQAYVALNGPLWGSLAALVPAGLYAWTGEPLWAAIASWWALVNLFNLLPIAPLDGGRVLHAFAFSYSSSLGVALSLLGLAGAVALATAAGFSLIWLIALLGAMELASESQARAGARALRLLPAPARLGPSQWLHLRHAVGAAAGAPGDVLFLRGLERLGQAARAEPLRPGQIARWGLAYAGLAAALILLVVLLRHVPGADLASHILE
jgi:Zn-dependent protease